MKKNAIAAAAALMALPMIGQAGDGLTVSGYADVGIQHNNRDTAGINRLNASATNNSIGVDQVGVSLAKAATNGVSGKVGLIAGDDAATLSPNGDGGDFALSEAYLQYNTGALTITAGKFFTLAGSEVFASNGNANITRSNLFMIQALSLTGVRATFAVNDMLSLSAGAVNSVGIGSADTTKDNNDQKTAELNVTLTPMKNLTLAVTDYMGQEANAGGDQSPNLLDVVVNFGVTDSLTLGLNADINDYDDAAETKDTGFALYVGMGWTPSFKTTLRAETLTRESNSAPDLKAKEVTLTAGYAATSALDLLAEVRSDDRDGAPFAGNDKQTTFAAKAIFKF